MSDWAAFMLAVGILTASLSIGMDIKAGLKAIADAIKSGKDFNVRLPTIVIKHEDQR